MFPPSLPQHDVTSPARSAQLDEARGVYRYSYQWPPGVAVAAEVPRSDSYSPRYVAELLPISWDLFRNALGAGELFVNHPRLEAFFREEMRRVPALEPAQIGDWFLSLANAISAHATAEVPSSIESFRKTCNAIEPPRCWDSWDDDRTFAWQRVAGVNPMALARVARVPDHVAIDEATFARSVGRGSLAAALAEGRLFACDYAILDGAPCGETDGRRKALPAPYALFVSDQGALRPVAIQRGQRPESGVVAPGDGVAWQVARLAVQVADANVHETISHLGRTHMVMEAVTLALRRQLASRHPLHVLLLPHCEFTLAINHSAATNLIAPGGVVDRAFGATIQASAGLVKAGLDSFDLMASAPPAELASRGLDDAAILPEHPYRDDSALVFAAIARFAEAYVRLYYGGDADVAADVELLAFVDELGSSEGGRLKGLRRPASIADLTRLLSVILWTGTGQHAAVNFTQYPYMGAIPNMLGALWGAWPPADPGGARAMIDQMPPYNMALAQVHTVLQLSAIRLNHLGKYPHGHLVDPRARFAVEAFSADLARIDGVIEARDRGRFLPYPYLRPSQIPASIHI